MLRNSEFEILFDEKNGSIISVVNPEDDVRMNWCSTIGNWGLPRAKNQIKYDAYKELELQSFNEFENSTISVYSNDAICITSKHYFSKNGNLVENYTIKNLRDDCLFLEHGDIQFELPLNDNYTFAEECMKYRCNTHLWCGDNVVYINALKMGESDINLGMVLTKGAIKSYSIEDCKTNRRGTFLLNLGHIELLQGEEYVIEWEIFWHKGTDDFYSKALKYPDFLHITSPQFTVFENESIQFEIKSENVLNNVSISCDGKECGFEASKNIIKVSYAPTRLGEHRFNIVCDDIHTYTEFFVCEDIKTLIEKRIDFIVDKQQYRNENSPLNGAFLIYDNEEQYHIYDAVITDHNAARERVGMPLLIIKYLQNHPNMKFRKALDKYIEFLIRELFDPDTGKVFNSIGRNKKTVRLYNAPWISTLFTEMYYLTKDKKYLRFIIKLLNSYYSGGGDKFYPNGLSMLSTVNAFDQANMNDERNQIVNLFKLHTDNIVANSVFYPKHEVDYEQTIVTPAATYISEIAKITNDNKYVIEAKKHIVNLERFSGRQPSFHLNEIPIRFWDDFWFGKSRLFGDTFPHYWSCLTARAYIAYYNVSGNKKYKLAAEKCIRNCLCLFNTEGQGSAAYVYPFKSNGQKGQFYDKWANDQDYALYFLMLTDYFDI